MREGLSGCNLNTLQEIKLSCPLTAATAKFFKCFLLLSPWELDGCTATIPRGHSHLLKYSLLCTGLFSALLCTNIKKDPLPHSSLSHSIPTSTDRQAQQRQVGKERHLPLLWLFTVYKLFPVSARERSGRLHSCPQFSEAKS